MNEDNEVFSAAKVREHFEGASKYGGYLMKKIAETIENVHRECKDAKEKVSQSFRGAHEKVFSEVEVAAVMEGAGEGLQWCRGTTECDE